MYYVQIVSSGYWSLKSQLNSAQTSLLYVNTSINKLTKAVKIGNAIQLTVPLVKPVTDLVAEVYKNYNYSSQYSYPYDERNWDSKYPSEELDDVRTELMGQPQCMFGQPQFVSDNSYTVKQETVPVQTSTKLFDFDIKDLGEYLTKNVFLYTMARDMVLKNYTKNESEKSLYKMYSDMAFKMLGGKLNDSSSDPLSCLFNIQKTNKPTPVNTEKETTRKYFTFPTNTFTPPTETKCVDNKSILGVFEAYLIDVTEFVKKTKENGMTYSDALKSKELDNILEKYFLALGVPTGEITTKFIDGLKKLVTDVIELESQLKENKAEVKSDVDDAAVKTKSNGETDIFEFLLSPEMKANTITDILLSPEMNTSDSKANKDFFSNTIKDMLKKAMKTSADVKTDSVNNEVSEPESTH